MSAWAAVGSVLGSVLSGIFNSNSTSSTNESNLKIAQMNNEYNKQLLQMQLDYNQSAYEQEVEDWYKQQEYNSPANQRARYEEAGINPALAMIDGSTTSSTASSHNSANIPYSTAPTMQSTQYDFSGLGAAGAAIDQMAKTQSEINAIDAVTEGKQIENQYQSAILDNKIFQAAEQLKDMKYSNQKSMLENSLLSFDNSVKEQRYQNELQTHSLNVQQAEQNIINSKANTAYINALTAMSKYNLKFAEETKYLQVAQIAADVSLVGAQTKESYSRITENFSKILKNQLESEGIKVNNYILKATANSIISKQFYDEIKAQWDSYDYSYNSYLNKNSSGYNWRHYIEGFTKSLLPLGTFIKK